MTQTITLRLITRQAGGGEIVRTRRIDSGRALIGRDPACDIYLPDLSVDRQHAMLKASGQNRISVESLTGLTFEVDGKPAMRVELDAARPAVIGFGAFELAIGLGDEDDVAITVTRRKGGYPAGPGLFSLKASLFGRRRMAWAFALAILAICLAIPAAGGFYTSHLKIHPDRQWSTGHLSKAHAFLEKDCKSCHQQAFVSVRDSACLACHKAGGDPATIAGLDARLQAKGSPFVPLLIDDHADHRKLMKAAPPPPNVDGKVKAVFAMAFNHPTDRCASCHREHTTASPDPSLKASADILRPGKPTLVVVNDCAACHSKLKMRLPSTGLIDTPDWSHHPDFRPLVTVGFNGPQPRIQRVALSAHPVEQNGLIFSHRIHMSASGGVARQGEVLGAAGGYGGALTCANCHHAAGGSYKPIEMERDCGSCHSLAFAQTGTELKTLHHRDMRNVVGVLRGTVTAAPGPSIDPAVLRRALSPGGLCVDCHTARATAGPIGVEVSPVHLAQRVMPRGDFNHTVPAHAGLGTGAASCVDCHKATTSDRASDYLMSGISTCTSCHGKTEHDTPRAASAQCTTCHSYHAPGQAPKTPQDRTFDAIGLPAGVKPRGMLAF